MRRSTPARARSDYDARQSPEREPRRERECAATERARKARGTRGRRARTRVRERARTRGGAGPRGIWRGPCPPRQADASARTHSARRCPATDRLTGTAAPRTVAARPLGRGPAIAPRPISGTSSRSTMPSLKSPSGNARSMAKPPHRRRRAPRPVGASAGAAPQRHRAKRRADRASQRRRSAADAPHRA